LALAVRYARKVQIPYSAQFWRVAVVWVATTTTIAALPIVRLWVRAVPAMQQAAVVVAQAGEVLATKREALALNVMVLQVAPRVLVEWVVRVAVQVVTLALQRRVWVLPLLSQDLTSHMVLVVLSTAPRHLTQVAVEVQPHTVSLRRPMAWSFFAMP
jgi:hypothetical protein